MRSESFENIPAKSTEIRSRNSFSEEIVPGPNNLSKRSWFKSANSIRLISLIVIWNLSEIVGKSSSWIPSIAAVSFAPLDTVTGLTTILSPITFPSSVSFTFLSSANSIEKVEECKIPPSKIEPSSFNSTNWAKIMSLSATALLEINLP